MDAAKEEEGRTVMVSEGRKTYRQIIRCACTQIHLVVSLAYITCLDDDVTHRRSMHCSEQQSQCEQKKETFIFIHIISGTMGLNPTSRELKINFGRVTMIDRLEREKQRDQQLYKKPNSKWIGEQSEM